jgi:hypothetical protein
MIELRELVAVMYGPVEFAQSIFSLLVFFRFHPLHVLVGGISKLLTSVLVDIFRVVDTRGNQLHPITASIFLPVDFANFEIQIGIVLGFL